MPMMRIRLDQLIQRYARSISMQREKMRIMQAISAASTLGMLVKIISPTMTATLSSA